MADYTIRDQGAARSTETDLDDGTAYVLSLVECDWGVAQQPEPVEELHSQGATLYLPFEEAYTRRSMRLSGVVLCSSLLDREYKLSTLTKLLRGRKTIRRHGWELDVFGNAPVLKETGSPLAIAWECVFNATPPFWRLAVALNAVAYSSGLLYPDQGVPVGEAQPRYTFANGSGLTLSPGTGSHLTVNNWGSAFCYGAVTLANFPASTAVYVEGLGRWRVKVMTSGSGAATIPESSRLYLAPGDNGIRFEDSAGTALVLGSTASVDFGSTVMRYL